MYLWDAGLRLQAANRKEVCALSHWVAKFHPDDIPYAEEVLLGIEGNEYGFVVKGDDGEEYSDMPLMTEEEAMEEIKIAFEGVYSTFEWLDD